MIRQQAMKPVQHLRGVCDIGILMCVLCVNVFIAVEELWEGFEAAKRLPSVGLLGCFMQLRMQLFRMQPAVAGCIIF